MLDLDRPYDMLDSGRAIFLSFVLAIRHIGGTCFGVCTNFKVRIVLFLGKFIMFIKIKKNRSDLTSRLAAVSRLDLLYVSGNRGVGIL